MNFAHIAERKSIESGTDTVTYRRVQGGAGNQSSQQWFWIRKKWNSYYNEKIAPPPFPKK